MNPRGFEKSSLFLMEQVIAITVFAICASVCAFILARSYLTAIDAEDKKYALLAAESAAESFKAFGGLREAAESMGGFVNGAGDTASIYFRDDWRRAETAENAAFVMNLSQSVENHLIFLEISVVREGFELVSLSAAVRRGGL